MTSALESSIHMAMSLRAAYFQPVFLAGLLSSRQFEAALNHSGGCAVPGEKGIQHLSLTVDKLPRIWCGRLNRPRAAEGLETCCRGSPEWPSRRRDESSR